jgi:hypothetical protein
LAHDKTPPVGTGGVRICGEPERLTRVLSPIPSPLATLEEKNMKPLLTLATLAFTGIAGVAFAQTVDPYTPPPNERYEPGPVYVAQGAYVNEPQYMDEDELRILKRDARRVCGDKPDSMLDLNSWKVYRQCVFVELGGQPYYPYYPYQPYPEGEYAPN